jgi:ferredoxin
MARPPRIKIDYDKCVGSRLCTAIAPRVFRLNQDGQAAVANAQGDALNVIQTAAEACPVSAITVEQVDKDKQ